MADHLGDEEVFTIKRNHKTTDIFSLDKGKSVDPPYTLIYVSSKSVAQPIRFILRYGGIEYEDKQINNENWLRVKSNMPFEQVPVLSSENKQYHQTKAICRYFAKKLNLMGTDDLEDLQIDAVVDTVDDFLGHIEQFYLERKGTAKDKYKHKLFTETLPFYLKRLDECASNNDGYLACKKLTWADFYFVALLDYIRHMIEIDVTITYKNLTIVRKNVLEIPSIKNWPEKHPKQNM